MPEYGTAADFDQRLRTNVGFFPKPRSKTPSQNNYLHLIYPYFQMLNITRSCGFVARRLRTPVDVPDGRTSDQMTPDRFLLLIYSKSDGYAKAELGRPPQTFCTPRFSTHQRQRCGDLPYLPTSPQSPNRDPVAVNLPGGAQT
jgi:hypothetical protein